MSVETYTGRVGFGVPYFMQRNDYLITDPNWTRLDNAAALGSLCVQENERPISTTASVQVSAGSFSTSNGSIVTYAGTTGLAVTASAVTMVWLDEAGTIHTGSSYPTGPILRLATVTAASAAVTAIVDDRMCVSSTGGQQRRATRSVAATGTLTRADGLILADATSAAVALTLGTLTTADAGLEIVIVKVDASANTVTVATTSGGTVTLSAQYNKVRVIWSGTAWLTV